MDNPYLSAFEYHIRDLTWREQEVFALLAERLSDKEIGKTLHLAVSTVKWYNRQIYSKLGVSNRKQVVSSARDLQISVLQTNAIPENKSRLKHNIPAQLSSFIGRVKEVADVKQLLESSRLVVLTGAGGSGKTRLALQVAQEISNFYTDGVWLVELGVITDPTIVPNEIAKVLNVSAHGDAMHVEILKRYMEQKNILLVMDNFEHLDDAALVLGDLLAFAPKLTILVTSRARLNIYGEQEYSINPLELPDLDQLESADTLREYESVKMFIERTKATQTILDLRDEDVKAIAKICVRLDGLPLAIELAAPLAKIYGFVALSQRLEQDLDPLVAGPRDMADRQRTLQATMDWSYQLLNKKDRGLFDQLAVFRGGGTLEAVEYICGDALAGNVINQLTSLVENNLVIPVETADGELHFTMLETIREFSQKQIDSTSAVDGLKQKHAAYFADLAELSHEEIRGSRNNYWFTRLEVENLNLQFALAWSLEGGDPKFGFRMVGPLSYFWYYSGLIRENIRWINLALEKSTNATPVLRAKVVLTAGIVFYNLDEYEKSMGLLQTALEEFRRLGDELYEGVCLAHLSRASISSSANSKDVLAMVLEGLEIFRKFDNKAYIALAYDIMGDITRSQGDYKAAEKNYQTSLALSKETGERIREATLHANLGVVAFHLANYETAYRRAKKGLSLSMELPSQYGMAHHLALIAGPAALLGFPNRAARILGAADAALNKWGGDQKPATQLEVELYINSTQSALSEKAFQESWQEGRRMTIQAAATYALIDEEVNG